MTGRACPKELSLSKLFVHFYCVIKKIAHLALLQRAPTRTLRNTRARISRGTIKRDLKTGSLRPPFCIPGENPSRIPTAKGSPHTCSVSKETSLKFQSVQSVNGLCGENAPPPPVRGSSMRAADLEARFADLFAPPHRFPLPDPFLRIAKGYSSATVAGKYA